MCNKSNITGATCRTGTANPSRAPEYPSIFNLSYLGFVLFMLLNYDFRVKTIISLDFHVLFMLLVFIYVYWYPTWFLYQIMFVQYDGSHMWSRNCYPFTAPEFTPGFSAIRVARSLVFCVMFCRLLFLFLFFFFSSLYCLSFFDLQLLITPLILSNFSYAIVHFCDGVFLKWMRICTGR